MTERPYPEGIDCVWLASDREGYLAAFITAGAGPVPIEALKCDYVHLEDIEALVCGMPIVSGARLLVSVKRPDDFVDLAARGVFVYDWTDINRIARDAVGAYEPVAVPVKPIKLDVLPAELAVVATALQFVDVRFADEKPLNVCVRMSCRKCE